MLGIFPPISFSFEHSHIFYLEKFDDPYLNPWIKKISYPVQYKFYKFLFNFETNCLHLILKSTFNEFMIRTAAESPSVSPFTVKLKLDLNKNSPDKIRF
ncbi:hypothetical protein BpHYR1_012601 [Brachionus plicatilis]|uniref:Uncharacterized protein n=1 Tax=Brachionus plicatilis TaxID=10195 RepID=A0A3M7PEP9_BRAPC|nr:hypothetical protein BpHYR1_012601 [Brachionus plicatilis]